MSRKDTRHNQNGFVSIMVSMVIMGVLVLITVGFAALMRREQRQVLDRQLSTQAFYAAEAGVNDAVKAMNDNPGATIASSSCSTNVLSTYGFNNQVDPANGVAYTCVLINSTPNTLTFTIPKDKSIVVPLNSSAPFNRLTIGWQDDNGTNPPSTITANSPNHYLPPNGTSAGQYNVLGGIGTLRATFMPVSAGGGIPDRTTLTNNARTFFFYPNSAGSNNRNYSENGSFVDGRCGTPSAVTGSFCEGDINSIPNVQNAYLRLKALYKPVKVTIAVNGGGATLSGAQVVVDSTGKANDVLRRIQVRVPATPNFQLPEFAIQSMDTLCKRLNVWPGGGVVDPPAGYGPAECTPL